MGGKLEIIQADDETFEQLRESCLEEGIEVVDMRTWQRRAWNRTWRTGFWLLVLYFAIANYCRFKLAVGLSTVACTCTL